MRKRAPERLRVSGCEDTGDTGEVRDDFEIVPAGYHGGYTFVGMEAQFYDQPAAGAQDALGIAHQALVDFEAGGSGEEGLVRLPIADFALQAGFVA
jgi:hypothetical protein